MNLKDEIRTKLIGAVALFVLGYILFISIYNQIILQNEGFFYIIIFGGILILAFILLSLITKLIAITNEVKDGLMWTFIEFVLFINVAYLFTAFRLSYKTSVPADETVLYRAAKLMSDGDLSSKGMDIINQLIVYPSQYVYASILSVFFKLFGADSDSMIILNAIVLILIAFLADRTVRLIAGRTCGFVAAICTLFIPSQSFAVYSYSGEFFFCLVFLLALFMAVLVSNNSSEDQVICNVLNIVCGVVFGYLLFTEPLAFICVVLFGVIILIKRKESDDEYVKHMIMIFVTCIISVLIFNIIKSFRLGDSIFSVIGGELSRFKLAVNLETKEHFDFGSVFKFFHDNLDNKNINVRDNYYFLTSKDGETYSNTQNAWLSLGTQMCYMFVIVMAIANAYYMFRNKNENAIPGFLTLFGAFIMLFFKSPNETSTYFLFELLILIACIGLHYMYKNHHPEESAEFINASLKAAVEEHEDKEDVQAIERARSIIFGYNDAQSFFDEPINKTATYSSEPTLAVSKAEVDNAINDSLSISSVDSAVDKQEPMVQETVTYETDASGRKVKKVVRRVVKKTPAKATTPVSKPVIEPKQESVTKPKVDLNDPNVSVITYMGEDGKMHKKIVKKVVKKVPKGTKE